MQFPIICYIHNEYGLPYINLMPIVDGHVQFFDEYASVADVPRVNYHDLVIAINYIEHHSPMMNNYARLRHRRFVVIMAENNYVGAVYNDDLVNIKTNKLLSSHDRM